MFFFSVTSAPAALRMRFAHRALLTMPAVAACVHAPVRAARKPCANRYDRHITLMRISGLPGAPLASTIVVTAVIIHLETCDRGVFGSGELLRASKHQSLGLVVAMLPRQYVRALRAGTRMDALVFVVLAVCSECDSRRHGLWMYTGCFIVNQITSNQNPQCYLHCFPQDTRCTRHRTSAS